MPSVKRSRLSGTPNSGLFKGQNGSVFFSPALIENRSGNEIEIDAIGVKITSDEVYEPPVIKNTRLFRWGYTNGSKVNDSLYRTLFKEPTVTGTLTQTIPPGPTTTIKIK